ncbi:hypothetical protein T484DRAFT_1776979, partial [Baffinella frigidus]
MRAAVLLVLPLLASGFSPSSILLRPASSAGFTAAVHSLPSACPRAARVALTPRCVAVEGGGKKVQTWNQDPDPAMLADALEKAAQVVRSETTPKLVGQARPLFLGATSVVRDSGGCIDSLSFGAEWKEKFPDFPRERFIGTKVDHARLLEGEKFPAFPRERFIGTKISSFNKLLTLYGQEVFVVEPTKKKEVNLYILRDAAGDEGRRQYQEKQERIQILNDSPLAAFFAPFFEIRGGKMRSGGTNALPPNLASIKTLAELLDALEPNLISLAGGINTLAGKDAATALNHIKRLGHE